MKKKFLFLIMFLSVLYGLYNYKIESVVTDVKSYEAGDAASDIGVGTYKTKDGKTIVVGEDGTVKYAGEYALTVKENLMGNTLTGKIGTNKKSVTFYQINDSTFMSQSPSLNAATISYTDSTGTVYLYDYTVFKLDVTPVANSDGIFEVYHDGTKVNSYLTLQDAVDAANSGDTIKIIDDYVALEGTYINKNLTIDGLDHAIDRSGFNHSVFVVEEDVTLNLNNIIVDGGADEWEVDFDAVTFQDQYIPLKEGSITNDPKLTLSAVVVRGNLVTDNVNMKNNYTVSYGGAISVVSGSLTIKNSTFEHNFGNNQGGAINVGTNLNGKDYYSVDSLVVENSTFKNNYVANSNNASKFSVGHGGAINVVNTTKVKINGSYFYGNVAYYGKGAALNFKDQSTSNIQADQLGIDFIQAYITDTVFEYNWSGNDGFAIQSFAADLYIDGCTFKNNIGTYPGNSVGTISVESLRQTMRIYSSIKNSTFEENIGPVSVFGDHSSLIDADFENVTFKGNTGNETILLYSAVSSFKNCKFIDEDVTVGVIDARIYENYEIPPELTLENVTFENTVGPTDILVRKNKHNLELNTYNVILEGNTSADVDVWDNNKVTVSGDHEGIIKTDGETPSENVVIEEEANLVGEVVNNPNTYTLTLYYPLDSSEETVKYLYLEKDKVYTQAELYLMTFLNKDGYTLKYYTDKDYTTAWDYTLTSHLTVYGRWEEHNHEYLGSLIVYDNAIYEQCGCGYMNPDKKLGFVLSDNLYYDGKGKKLSLINTLNVSEEEYTISYQYKDKDGNYIDMNDIPVKMGEYKMILTYGTYTIEAEYSIIEKSVNPSTGIVTPYIVCGLVAMIGIIGISLYRNKKFM